MDPPRREIQRSQRRKIGLPVQGESFRKFEPRAFPSAKIAIAFQASLTQRTCAESQSSTSRKPKHAHDADAGLATDIIRDSEQTPPRTSSRANELCMPKCEVCENDYDKAFEVVVRRRAPHL